MRYGAGDYAEFPDQGTVAIRARIPHVIACDKREAFVQGSEATKQSTLSLRGEMDCFASLAMTAFF
jgi:hypothetical protein